MEVGLILSRKEREYVRGQRQTGPGAPEIVTDRSGGLLSAGPRIRRQPPRMPHGAGERALASSHRASVECIGQARIRRREA